MNQFEKAAVVLALAESLKKNGSWTGETHVQKALYFVQEMLGAEECFSYILYKHGPFSFDLREMLTYMQAQEFISWVPQPPYGPSLNLGNLRFH